MVSDDGAHRDRDEELTGRIALRQRVAGDEGVEVQSVDEAERVDGREATGDRIEMTGAEVEEAGLVVVATALVEVRRQRGPRAAEAEREPLQRAERRATARRFSALRRENSRWKNGSR